jgi:hypothetical protein
MINSQHYTRCIKQHLSRLELGIIGGYHLGNLGDMALGAGVERIGRELGISCGLQTIYNLQFWKNVGFGIVGGGACTQKDNLQRVFSRFRGRLEKLAFCGVDIEDWEALDDLRDELSRVAYFSTRSREQALRANEMLGSGRVAYHPDIVFSLRDARGQHLGDTRAMKTAVLNMCPRFHLQDPTKLCCDAVLAEPVPFGVLRDNYSYLCRLLVDRLTSEGFALVHVPFTPSDDVVGKSILTEVAVQWMPYSANPRSVMRGMRDAQYCFASRYHSVVFALINKLPLLALAYADKTARLFHEMGIAPSQFLDLNDLTSRASIERKINSVGIGDALVDDSVVEGLTSASRQGIEAAFAAVLANRA